MGKQVNYIMNYESFLQLAQFALDLGCMIVHNKHTDKPSFPSGDLSVVVPDCNRYYFYIPALYPIDKIKHHKDCYGKYYLLDSESFSLALIEAGFSLNETDAARIYVTTGYYDENENWVARPELLTKTYDNIARRARKPAQRII